jgi:hypothetical protein
MIINMYRGDFIYKEISLTESSVSRHSIDSIEHFAYPSQRVESLVDRRVYVQRQSSVVNCTAFVQVSMLSD